MTRGRDGRPRPHRSGEPEQFHRCGDVAALQALAGATRAAGRECWCSVLPRSEPVAGGKAVPGGAVLWADVDTPGTLWRVRALRRRLPVRLVVESGGAPDPSVPRWHIYLAASRWLAAHEIEAANARLADLLGGDRVGDRGRLMRLPGTRNLKAGRPGRWCRVVACNLHAPALDVESVVGALPDYAPRPPASMHARQHGRGRPCWTSSLRASGSPSSSPTVRSANTATRGARCTTTTSPRSSSMTSRPTGGTAGRARVVETSSSTRLGVGMASRAAASMHPAFAR